MASSSRAQLECAACLDVCAVKNSTNFSNFIRHTQTKVGTAVQKLLNLVLTPVKSRYQESRVLCSTCYKLLASAQQFIIIQEKFLQRIKDGSCLDQERKRSMSGQSPLDSVGPVPPQLSDPGPSRTLVDKEIETALGHTPRLCHLPFTNSSLSSNPLTSMHECVNCCTPLDGGSKVVGLNLSSMGGKDPLQKITPTSALNFIYRVSGKEIPISLLNSDGSPEFQLGLCFTCWDVVFQLFLLHEKLTALTNLNSIVNKTFQVLDETSNTVIHRKTVVPNGDGLQLVNTSSSIPNSLTVTEDEHVPNPDEEEIADVNFMTPESIKLEVTEGPEEIFGDDPYPYGDPLASPEPEGSYLETEHVMEEIIVKVEPVSTESDETSHQGSENLDMDADSPYDPLNPDTPPQNPRHEPEHPLSLNFRGAMRSKNLSYSGTCSDFDCTHVFKSVTQFYVRKHFYEAHKRTVEILRACHICGETLISNNLLRDDAVFKEHVKGKAHVHSLPEDDSSLETLLLKDFTEFNENTIRSMCGLGLTRDGIPGSQSQVSSKTDGSPWSQKWLCPECGSTFEYESALKIHTKTHLPQVSRRLFKCPEPKCNYSASQIGSLNTHKAMKHVEAKFKFHCPRCSEGFLRAGPFMDHQGFCCDPAERPHLCDICGKRYETKEYLDLHYSEFHKMVQDEKGEWVLPRPSLRRSYAGPGAGSISTRTRAVKLKTEPID